jgi:Protein of unknown function (DUF3828)
MKLLPQGARNSKEGDKMRRFGIAWAAVAMSIGATGAAAQPARQQSAEAFARSLYHGVQWRNRLTPDLARLQHAVEARTQGEVPDYLDADPLCACQDDAGLRVLSVRTAPARGGLVQASVHFNYSLAPREPAQTVRLTLARSGRSWRIQDIDFPAGARRVSYRWALQQNLRPHR